MNLIFEKKITPESVHLFVRNGEHLVWEQRYPSFTEDQSSGEMIAEYTLVEAGAMKDFDDVEGLKNHLFSNGIISETDTIIV